MALRTRKREWIEVAGNLFFAAALIGFCLSLVLAAAVFMLPLAM